MEAKMGGYSRQAWPGMDGSQPIHSTTETTGTDGRDQFDGNDSVTAIALGKGDDVYVVGPSQHPVEAPGEGTDMLLLNVPTGQARSETPYQLPENVELNYVNVWGAVNLIGSSGDNAILASRNDDIIDGGKGDDLLCGNSGYDLFIVSAGNGNDSLTDFNVEPWRNGGSYGRDQLQLNGYDFAVFNAVVSAMHEEDTTDIVGRPTTDVILDLGNGEHLTFFDRTIASFKADEFDLTGCTGASGARPFDLPTSTRWEYARHGGEGADTFISTDNLIYLHQKFDGKGGIDIMAGGPGDDTYVVDSLHGDTIIENAGYGVDTVISWASRYTLAANVENLEQRGTYTSWMTGNELDNRILGNDARNFIHGEAGRDIVTGGGGADDLWGGTGGDMFVYAAASDGGDTIHDFKPGEDLIDLRPLFINTGTDPTADHVRLVQAGPSMQIWFDADGTGSDLGTLLTTLIGVAAHDLYTGSNIVL
jgi:Ca2+-binding RTX toxin-like protein